jgi:hypothetical protein
MVLRLQWLGKQSFLDDLASLDPELYQGLIFLKNYTGNPEELSLDFSITESGEFFSASSATQVTKQIFAALVMLYMLAHS